MKRLWRAIEVLAWTAFFAFAALVLALRYWFLPNIERYRDQIVAAVSRTVGQQVRIGGIETGWVGMRPHISLTDVRIIDAEGREVLALPSVGNVVSWQTIATRSLRLHSLVIDRPRLDVRRDKAGTLYIAGVKLSQDKSEQRFTDWILAQDEIVIRDAEIEWRDEKRGAPPLALAAVNLKLRNSGAEHSIGLTARPPAALGTSFELRAELDAPSMNELTAWNGRLYIETGYTDLAAWRAWLDYPFDVRRGQGALRLWATLTDGKPTEGTADVALSEFAARLAAELPVLELASLQGRLQGRMKDESYELSGRGVALQAKAGPAMPASDFELHWTPGMRGALTANAIELEPAARLAAALPLPGELRGKLEALSPRGRLIEPKLEWSGAPSAPQRFSAQARFAEVAVRPYEKFPGFAGLSGSVDASETKGSVTLAAKKAELEFPRIFPEPRIALASLAAQLTWQRQSGRGFSVRLASASFANEHVAGTASGSYIYAGAGPGSIDLSAQLSRADGSYTAKYLPSDAILGKAIRDWVASAVVSATASDVRLRLKGDLREFPFAESQRGDFRVSARFTKGVLDYANGWPRIYDIDGELLFERDRMEVTARSATVLGARLAAVRAVLPRIGKPRPELSITGQADGDSSEFLKYIESSPVRKMVAVFTDAMSASGRGKLRLKLDLPLAELAATKVAGEFEFFGNTVQVSPGLPPLERASGTLSFTQSAVTVSDVRGRIFGGTVVISGGTKADAGVEVIAKGEATVAGTRALFDHPLRRYLSGATTYVATVNVREGRTRILFESTLRGIAAALPPPLAKASGDALPLRVELIPAEGGLRDRVTVALGRVAAAEFQRRRQGEQMVVQRAGISLTPTGDAVRLPDRPGTLIYGSLGAFDLDRWLALMPSGEGGTAASSFDVAIGMLDAYGKRLHDVRLRAGSDAAGWSASMTSVEIAGDLAYRGDAGGKLTARLTHFILPEDYPGARREESDRSRDLPAVDFIAERFNFHGKELGRVEFVAQRADADWRIDKISIANPEASLSGRGAWYTAPSRTLFDFELETHDAGRFLARVGYPDVVKGGKARMQGHLAWDGEPTAFDYPSLSGHLQMQAQDGQFLEIEPGLGKLVSLMSLQALPKRLSLDFRDVFSKGFQFDRIASDASVDSGVMALKEFRMRGSAAQVDMTGDVNLAKETQNLRVRVVPSLADTASTAVLLVNPWFALPAVIAQRILKDPLGHIFAFDYSITGTWDDPKVAKLGVEAKAIDNEAR